jgi:hypothetical protein
MKASGVGTAMFSRAGRTTIDQYMCFGDGTKTNEMAERHNQSFGHGTGQDGSRNMQSTSVSNIENYDSCFGNKLQKENLDVEVPKFKENKEKERKHKSLNRNAS